MLTTGDRTWRMPRLPRFARNRLRDTSHQRRIPGRGQTDGQRKHGGVFGASAVNRFFERNDRDAEPRLFDEVALDRVDALRVRPRAVLAVRRANLQPENAVASSRAWGRPGLPGIMNSCQNFSSSVMRAQQVADARVDRLIGAFVQAAG